MDSAHAAFVVDCADPVVIDCADPSWVRLASKALQQHLYARLRLPAEEVQMIRDMYSASEQMFSDDNAKQQLRIPPQWVDDLDGRSGYVPSKDREYLELHTSTPAQFDGPISAPAAVHALECASRVTRACRARVNQVLCELVQDDCSPLGQLLEAEERSVPPAPGALETSVGYSESMLRVYRYSRHFLLHKGDAHYDMGLLTLIPRGSSPGLQIRPDPRQPWLHIERRMAEDEAILFAGMTLARLTNITALQHRVEVDGQVRMSAPYFHRPSPRTLLAATPGHACAEPVAHYNART